MSRRRRFSASLLFGLMLIVLGASSALAQGEYHVGDDAISERVRTAIHKDPVLRMMDIAVETRGAVVQLRGFVRTMADIGKATELVRGVVGVMAVRNGLRIADQPSRA
jgi:osmotically-inducible protein OsmY